MFGRKKQKSFIKDLSQTIIKDMVKSIESGRVPDSFDGHELRCWLADRFEESAKMSVIRRDGRGSRAKHFNEWYQNLPR